MLIAYRTDGLVFVLLYCVDPGFIYVTAVGSLVLAEQQQEQQHPHHTTLLHPHDTETTMSTTATEDQPLLPRNIFADDNEPTIAAPAMRNRGTGVTTSSLASATFQSTAVMAILCLALFLVGWYVPPVFTDRATAHIVQNTQPPYQTVVLPQSSSNNNTTQSDNAETTILILDFALNHPYLPKTIESTYYLMTATCVLLRKKK
jgi:hypothetical protein